MTSFRFRISLTHTHLGRDRADQTYLSLLLNPRGILASCIFQEYLKRKFFLACQNAPTPEHAPVSTSPSSAQPLPKPTGTQFQFHGCNRHRLRCLLADVQCLQVLWPSEVDSDLGSGDTPRKKSKAASSSSRPLNPDFPKNCNAIP